LEILYNRQTGVKYYFETKKSKDAVWVKEWREKQKTEQEFCPLFRHQAVCFEIVRSGKPS